MLRHIVNQITNLNMQHTIDMRIFLPEDHVEIDLFLFEKKEKICVLIIGDHTAVRLQGDHRVHDYINANEIKVIKEEMLFKV